MTRQGTPGMAVYIWNFSTQEAKFERLTASLTSLGYIAEACFQNTGREGGRKWGEGRQEVTCVLKVQQGQSLSEVGTFQEEEEPNRK